MFQDCSLMVILATNDGCVKIKRIIQDPTTQTDINNVFSNASNLLTKDKTPVTFDGKYVPREDDNEFLIINNYQLGLEIKEVLDNPQGVEIFEPVNGIIPFIKALFIGKYEVVNGVKNYSVAFQKFKSDQYISQSKHHLFYDNNTFRKELRIGFSVSNYIDCLFKDNSLKFVSFFFARQILDLSYYYREATTEETNNFATNSLIQVYSPTEFCNQSDTWTRRKIASINDSGMLSNYSANDIKKIAKKSGVIISIENDKIVIPSDKKELKKVLSFLDEEVYKGPLTTNTYITNSKKRI